MSFAAPLPSPDAAAAFPALITVMNIVLPMLALFGAMLPGCSAGAPSSANPREQQPPVAAARRSYAKNEAVCCGHLHTDGSMWFGTNHEGAYRYDGRSFIRYPTRDGLAGERITAITHDARGNLWFGTDRGLCRYDGTNFGGVGQRNGVAGAQRRPSDLFRGGTPLWLRRRNAMAQRSPTAVRPFHRGAAAR